eukprot:TRINITY_DN20089_c0_g1_i1.p1 TRINITY_DN20089_c0_g1~~TRINITY_DN20089_c0_g1_i1.p1  ORF type:complete len:276 (-),score=43.87 TRINITY_DN20089_c0_g1_i1:339-1097(-)
MAASVSFALRPSVGTWLLLPTLGDDCCAPEADSGCGVRLTPRVLDLDGDSGASTAAEEAEVVWHYTEPLLSSPSAEQSEKSSSDGSFVSIGRKVAETVQRGRQHLADTAHQGVEYVTENATAQAARIQRGVNRARSKSRERMQGGIETVLEKTEPLQRGLGYARGKADAAAASVVNAVTAVQSVSSVSAAKASASMQNGFDVAKERADAINEKLQKGVDFVACKTDLVTKQVAHVVREGQANVMRVTRMSGA